MIRAHTHIYIYFHLYISTWLANKEQFTNRKEAGFLHLHGIITSLSIRDMCPGNT